jgi:hypothetical protein
VWRKPRQVTPGKAPANSAARASHQKYKPLKLQQPVAFSGIIPHIACGHFLEYLEKVFKKGMFYEQEYHHLGQGL